MLCIRAFDVHVAIAPRLTEATRDERETNPFGRRMAWTRLATLFLIIALTTCLFGKVAAQPPTTNVRMQTVLREFVSQTGAQIIGLGSWISGRNYSDPLGGGSSDHDMRLLLPKGTSRVDAVRQWQTARDRLSAMIRSEFGSDAERVLQSCNLYAPTQLMSGVETAEDALERFRQLNQLPNMAFKGNVGKDTSAKFAEGLYGDGAKTWTQKYERDAGRLFYSQGGRAFIGMSDLTHLDEGFGKYTISGMAGTSAQWVEHAEEALASENGKSLAKYLERLDRDLAKAKDLARCDLSDPFRAELKELAAELRRNPSAIGRVGDKVKSVLFRANVESSLLTRMGRAGAVRTALLKSILIGSGPATRLRDLLVKAAEKVPAEQLVNGLFAYWSAKEISGALAEGKEGDALAAIAPYLLPLGPSLLASLANAMVESAKDAGYSLAASSQNAWDLLAGIYSAGGRPEVDNVGNFTLDQLVNKVWDEKKVEAIIFAKSRLASMRGAGSATGSADEKVAQAIFDRCAPIILRAWRAKREALLEEYLGLVERFDSSDMILSYSPEPAKLVGKGDNVVVTVSVEAQSTDPGEYERSERMRAILGILVGPRQSYVSISFKWTTPSAPGGSTPTMSYTFRKPAMYPVVLVRTLTVDGPGIQGDPLLRTRIERESSVLVEVLGETKKAVPAKAQPASTGAVSQGRWVCVNVQKGDNVLNPGRVKKAEFGEGHFKATMLTPSGQENAFEASWTVPPAVLVPGKEVTLSGSIVGVWGRMDLQGSQLVGQDPSSPKSTNVKILPPRGGSVFQIMVSIQCGVAFVSESRYYDYKWVPAGSPDPPNAVDPSKGNGNSHGLSGHKPR